MGYLILAAIIVGLLAGPVFVIVSVYLLGERTPVEEPIQAPQEIAQMQTDLDRALALYYHDLIDAEEYRDLVDYIYQGGVLTHTGLRAGYWRLPYGGQTSSSP